MDLNLVWWEEFLNLQDVDFPLIIGPLQHYQSVTIKTWQNISTLSINIYFNLNWEKLLMALDVWFHVSTENTNLLGIQWENPLIRTSKIVTTIWLFSVSCFQVYDQTKTCFNWFKDRKRRICLSCTLLHWRIGWIFGIVCWILFSDSFWLLWLHRE